MTRHTCNPNGGVKRLRFTPQVWVNGYAIEAAPQGPVTCEVPGADVAGLQDDTYESDDLRHHPNAPTWWADWSGPFYIAIEDV